MLYRNSFCFALHYNYILLFLIIQFLLIYFTHGANPVAVPIIPDALEAHTQRFAKIPDFEGAPASIICLVPLGDDLIVCTLTIIYRVSPAGEVSLFLDVAEAILAATGRTLNLNNRQHGGVRSIAFHPGYARNGLCYISAMETRPSNPQDFNYISDVSNPIRADSVLIEFRVSRETNLPIVSSYRNVFRIGMPVFDHPIKQIAFFGRQLYIAHGDGSVQSAIAGGGQGPDALGKILRINPRASQGLPYTVPRFNPFVNDSNMPSEVYAIGFRNPHHLCFGTNGKLFVADAGRDNIEEVNVVKRGRNYGWSQREGTFVHLSGGGLLNGISALPEDDEINGFEYPVAQVGHEGEIGDGFVGQAIAGACPVENGSPMTGNYYYSDFPRTGNLYFSKLDEINAAVTNGPPDELTQAPTYQAYIMFDHDDDPLTPSQRFENLGDVMRSEPEFQNQGRVDVRFGRGSRGELYWSSKGNGRVYLFTSSLTGGMGGVPQA